jgi:dolichol-phosphate mannosyltransferase
VRKDVLIALPTYDEAENLESMVRQLRAQDADTHILVIDDDSPDGTGRVADRLASEVSGVEVIHRPRKSGLGSAHRRAMDFAVAERYRVLVTMDVDFTHRPEDVARLVATLDRDGLDVVIGSRYLDPRGIESWPMWRQVISRTAHLATVGMLGIEQDATNAFRAFRVEALPRVAYRDVKSDGYSFMFELAFACRRAGLRIGELAVEMSFRQAGHSKISRTEIIKALVALGQLTIVRISDAVGPGSRRAN